MDFSSKHPTDVVIRLNYVNFYLSFFFYYFIDECEVHHYRQEIILLPEIILSIIPIYCVIVYINREGPRCSGIVYGRGLFIYLGSCLGLPCFHVLLGRISSFYSFWFCQDHVTTQNSSNIIKGSNFVNFLPSPAVRDAINEF